MHRIGIGTAPVGTVYGPTSLDCLELVWMLSGRARWTGGGQTYRIGPGQILLVGAGVVGTIEWQPAPESGRVAEHTRHGYVHFTLSSGTLSGGRAQLHQLHDPDVRADLLRYLAELARLQPPGWQRPASTTVAALLRLMQSGILLEHRAARSLPEPIERVAAHLATVWSEHIRPLSLNELATAASTSQGHLCRNFRATFSLGPVRCVDLVRLAHAAHLLARSNMTVVQVAHLCGYATPYHFSRRFRSAFGVPPSAYRSGIHAGTADSILARHELTPFAERVWPILGGPTGSAQVGSPGGFTMPIRDLAGGDRR